MCLVLCDSNLSLFPVPYPYASRCTGRGNICAGKVCQSFVRCDAGDIICGWCALYYIVTHSNGTRCQINKILRFNGSRVNPVDVTDDDDYDDDDDDDPEKT